MWPVSPTFQHLLRNGSYVGRSVPVPRDVKETVKTEPPVVVFLQFPPDDCLCQWMSPDDRGWRMSARNLKCDSSWHEEAA